MTIRNVFTVNPVVRVALAVSAVLFLTANVHGQPSDEEAPKPVEVIELQGEELGSLADRQQAAQDQFRGRLEAIKRDISQRYNEEVKSVIDSLKALGYENFEIARRAVRASYETVWYQEKVIAQAKYYRRLTGLYLDALATPAISYASQNTESVLRRKETMKEINQKLKDLDATISRLKTQLAEDSSNSHDDIFKDLHNKEPELRQPMDSLHAQIEELEADRDSLGIQKLKTEYQRSNNWALRPLVTETFLRLDGYARTAGNLRRRIFADRKQARRKERRARELRQVINLEHASDLENRKEDYVNPPPRTDPPSFK